MSIRVRPLLPVTAGLLLSIGMLAAQTKIAVISAEKALTDTAEIKKAQALMEAKFKPEQDKVAARQKALADVEQKLQTMAGKLTPQAEADYQNQGRILQRDITRLTEDLQADVDRHRADILGPSSERMREVIKKLAEEKGLDLVVADGTSLYFKPALDITKDATAAYDKAYPPK